MSSFNQHEIIEKLNSIEGMIQHLTNQMELLTKSSNIKTSKESSSSSSNFKKEKKPLKTGNVVLTKYTDFIVITGDTFDKKSVIKSCGGFWSPGNKGWIVKIENFENIKSKLEKHAINLQIIEENNQLPVDTTKKTIHIQQKDSNKNANFEEYGFIDDD